MWVTIYSGEAVVIDMVQGEDFEQAWVFKDEDSVAIPFITDGWGAKAAIGGRDRTGKEWSEDMTVTLSDDGTVLVKLDRSKTIGDPVGTHLWTLFLIEPGTGYYNAVFNAPAIIHAGAVKIVE